MTEPQVEKTEKITITARWQEEMQGPQSRLYAALTEVCAGLLGVAALAPWRGRAARVVHPGADTDRATLIPMTSARGDARVSGERGPF